MKIIAQNVSQSQGLQVKCGIIEYNTDISVSSFLVREVLIVPTAWTHWFYTDKMRVGNVLWQ